LSASILGREIGVEGVLEKTCEKCHGDGELAQTRQKRLDELSDAETKFLLHADIYRENGGRDPEEVEREMKQAKSGANVPSAGPSPNVPSSTNF